MIKIDLFKTSKSLILNKKLDLKFLQSKCSKNQDCWINLDFSRLKKKENKMILKNKLGSEIHMMSNILYKI